MVSLWCSLGIDDWLFVLSLGIHIKDFTDLRFDFIVFGFESFVFLLVSLEVALVVGESSDGISFGLHDIIEESLEVLGFFKVSRLDFDHSSIRVPWMCFDCYVARLSFPRS